MFRTNAAREGVQYQITPCVWVAVSHGRLSANDPILLIASAEREPRDPNGRNKVYNSHDAVFVQLDVHVLYRRAVDNRYMPLDRRCSAAPPDFAEETKETRQRTRCIW